MADPWEEPVAPYLATLDGVRALLPKTPIDAYSKPNAAGVHGILVEASEVLAGRFQTFIDALDDAAEGDDGRTVRNRVETLCRAATHLYAGATVENGVNPERAQQGDASSYGAVLWARYRELTMTIGTLLGLDANGQPTSSASVAKTVVLHTGPDPLMQREYGF